MPKTDQQIVDEVNAIARMNLGIIGTGYQVPDGHRFYEATDPRSKLAWNHAVEVYEFVTGTEVGDALSAVQEEAEPVLPTRDPLNRLAQVEAQNTWLKERLANLQLPEFRRATPVQVEQWLCECGMPAVFVEVDRA
jgi:hypothetical protein